MSETPEITDCKCQAGHARKQLKKEQSRKQLKKDTDTVS